MESFRSNLHIQFALTIPIFDTHAHLLYYSQMICGTSRIEIKLSDLTL